MRMCSVYFISNEDGLVKVGHAKNPERRIVGIRVGSPQEVKIEGVIRARRDSKMESALHGVLRNHWVRGEWFDIPDDILDDLLTFGETLGDVYIEDAIGSFGVARELVRQAASDNPSDRDAALTDVKDAVAERVRENREANE